MSLRNKVEFITKLPVCISRQFMEYHSKQPGENSLEQCWHGGHIHGVALVAEMVSKTK